MLIRPSRSGFDRLRVRADPPRIAPFSRAGEWSILTTMRLDSTAVCAALLAAAVGAGCTEAPRPNVLLVTIDTLRADHLEPYGYARPTSPALAEFAAGATVFEAAQSQSSWTLPALASLMTGLYPSTHQAVSFRARLESSFTTLAEELRNAGYETAAVANHMFLGRSYGLDQGFTHFDDELVRHPETQLHLTVTSPRVADKAVTWLEQRAAAGEERPWFLWTHFFDPHNEYLAHDDVASMAGADGSDPDIDLYDEEIAFTDRGVGRILVRLEELGLAEDTVVVVTSDHGEAFGEHGRTHHSDSLYQELLHVPLLVRVPGAAPRRVAEPVQTCDVVPTVLECASVASPESLAGTSLLPLVRGTRDPEREVLSEVRAPEYVPGPELVKLEQVSEIASLTVGRYKLIHQVPSERTELYDLEADPLERVDVAAEHPELVGALRRKLRAKVDAAADYGRSFSRTAERTESAAELDGLEALGYVERR